MEIKIKYFLVIGIFFSCNSHVTKENSQKYFWKYNDGFHAGDYIIFEGDLKNGRISNDTLFVWNEPKGLIKQYYRKHAIVTSFDKTDIGEYTFKGLIKAWPKMLVKSTKQAEKSLINKMKR